MDEADKADAQIDAALSEARYLARQQALLSPALRPRGSCHYCREPVAAPLLYCDASCRDDFQAEDDALRRMGRK